MHKPLTTTLLLSLASLIAFIAISAIAQEAPQQPAPPTAAVTQPATEPATQPVAEALPTAPPAGAVLTDEQGKPVDGVRLAKADLQAVVRGPLAQVTVTLTFANNQGRILGGELMFPLPEGATVTGYGLEVNGSMVDGVAVDKQQAGDIYESESYKRVDPGLVEHVAGNAFRTRLYPVPANGSRSARVQYVTEVACTRDGATLSLPMGWGKVHKCTVRIVAPEAAVEPAVGPGAEGLTFHRAAHGFVAEGALRATPNELVIRLAGPNGRSATIEKWPRDGASATETPGRIEDFEHYFLLNDTPPAAPPGPAPDVAAELKAKAVRRVAILWDAGLSRAQADKRRELKLLESLLKAWDGATGELVVFRDTAGAPVSFDLGTPHGRTKVIEQLAGLTYDGASDLGDLPLPKNAHGFTRGALASTDQPKAPAGAAGKAASDYDCLLLFTDGMGGVGPPMMHKAAVPVYAFSDDARVNGNLLQHVCRESGGRYYKLRDVIGGDEMREAWSLLSVEFKQDEVAEVFPTGPIVVEGLGRLTISGRLLVPRATVTLNYGYGNRPVSRQMFTLTTTDATEGDLVTRYWAQQKVADLSLDSDANDRELTRIGKRFNLVTPNTSLLVLETVNQYVHYHVTPPRSQPELYQEFLTSTGQDPAQGQPARAQQWPVQTPEQLKFEGVLAAWNLHVHWWEDPKPVEGPAPDPLSGALPWGSPAPVQQDRPDPRGDDRRATVQHAADVRQSRELAREAAQARRTGDSSGARDLYARSAVLDPKNAAAVRGISELDEGSRGEGRKTMNRLRPAEQAEWRAIQSIAAFRGALERSGHDVDHNDLAAADSEINQAREVLGANLSDLGADERKELEARLTEAKQAVDSARRSAQRNGPALRMKTIADAHAQRAEDERRGGVNIGGSYHRSDYGWGSGGGSASLFGNSAGGTSANPPAPSTGSPTSPRSVVGQTPAAPAPAAPPAASLGAVTPLVSTVIRPWSPARPYLTAMNRAPSASAYEAYLVQRGSFGTSPAFYLDSADYLELAGQHAMAVRAVTDVAAFHLPDANLLRRAAFRFQDLGERDRAIEQFERVLEMRPDVLQGYRDLALALSDRADALAALPTGDSRHDEGRIAADYGRCLDLLNRAILRGERPDEIGLVCLMDANRVIARLRRLRRDGTIPRVPVPLDPRLIRNLDCDLRVVVTWDTDQTRANLSVVEPDRDTASASAGNSNQTRIGGRVDGFIGGYGPQEYCLRTLSPGVYQVETSLGASLVARDYPDPSGPCTLRVTVFTDFGRASETRKSLSVRVTDIRTLVEIGIVASRGAAPRFRKPGNVQSFETLP